MTEREQALFCDLHIACTNNNPCLVCGHFRPDQNGLQKCELNEWVCNWEWRGMERATVSDRQNPAHDGCIRAGENET